VGLTRGQFLEVERSTTPHSRDDPEGVVFSALRMAALPAPTAFSVVERLAERGCGCRRERGWSFGAGLGRRFGETCGLSGGAERDVAWLRRQGAQDALFLFEGESRPSSGVAENAAKVLSVPTKYLPKPLFFFHVVLSGGGGRPARAARSHDSANYGIYLFGQDEEAQRFLSDVLAQHARLASTLNPYAFWEALRDERAPGFSIADVIGAARRLLPASAWTRELSVAAIDDEAARTILADLLLPLSLDPFSGDNIASYLGSYCAPALQLGILASLRPALGPACLKALEVWQAPMHGGRLVRIGPHWGLAQDYDVFVLGYAPLFWTLLAVLLRDVADGPAWVGVQLQTVLDDERLRGPALAPTAAWSLHLARAFQLDSLAAAVFRAARRVGGFRPDDMRSPPTGVPTPDDAVWHTLSERHESEAVLLSAVPEVDVESPIPRFDVVGAALMVLLYLGDLDVDAESIVAYLGHLASRV
jgi:hypothetical protein